MVDQHTVFKRQEYCAALAYFLFPVVFGGLNVTACHIAAAIFDWTHAPFRQRDLSACNIPNFAAATVSVGALYFILLCWHRFFSVEKKRLAHTIVDDSYGIIGANLLLGPFTQFACLFFLSKKNVPTALYFSLFTLTGSILITCILRLAFQLGSYFRRHSELTNATPVIRYAVSEEVNRSPAPPLNLDATLPGITA